MRGWRALLAVAFWVSVGACGPGGSDVTRNGAGGNDPRCNTYCHARQTKGCGGDESICKLACNVDYSSVAPSQGSCTPSYTALIDCKNDPAILDLGCSPPPSKTDDFCKSQGDAYKACVKLRDGS